MKENFEIVKFWVKADEGGYTNDPRDHGGPTNFGITLHDYHLYISPKGTAEDVRDMSFEQAAEIYKKRYWDRCSCDLLPAGVDYFVFDSAILSGEAAARKWLQIAVGSTPDGIIGPKTLEALAKDEPLDVLTKLEALRRSRLRALAQWPIWRKGWTNRVNKCKKRALKLIGKKPIAPPPQVTDGTHLPPAHVDEPTKTPATIVPVMPTPIQISTLPPPKKE